MRVFLCLLLLTIAESNAGCPTMCNCTPHAVACIQKSLECVPYFEKLSNNPRIIDLSSNDISIIEFDDFSFDKSDEVIEIYLNNSNINTIEEMAFLELTNLQELYLADNLINGLPSKLFKNNHNLILLDLSRNLFQYLPKITSKSLEVLMLAKCALSTIDNDALSNLPNLRLLHLQENSLKLVDPIIFEGLPHFYYVDFSFNPWACSCKTVKLFNYLTGKSLTEIRYPIQCKEEEQFIDIYNTNGVTHLFKTQCASPIEEIVKLQNLTNRETKSLDYNNTIQLHKLPSGEQQATDSNQDGYFRINIYCLLMFVALPLSFLAGFLFGRFWLSFRKMAMKLRNTNKPEDVNKNLI